MSRVVGALGLVLLGLGLLIALFPFISVWRVSGQVLDELPEISGSESTDQRHRFRAMFDDDFVLATRTYRDTTVDSVLDALARDGFKTQGIAGRRWLTRPCCGEYDAVGVDVQETDRVSVVAILTVADSDFQVSWPFFAFFGIALASAGSVMTFGRSVGRRHTRGESVPA